MGGSIDYSDFEYQVVSLENRISSVLDTTNPSVDTVFSIEPLQFAGGLSQNEVAELVYLETYVGLETEDEGGAQTAATTAEARGAIGINFPNSQDAFVSKVQQQTNPQDANSAVIRASTGVDIEDDVNALSSIRTDERFLQFYRAMQGPAFDDDTGAGGSQTHDHFRAQKNYRQLTGRGPVFDANDDLSVSSSVNIGNTVNGGGANIRLHCVWDVAEVDDAGRAFSVPDGM
jgi:hypothetical protein